jgi:hypothetical protein
MHNLFLRVIIILRSTDSPVVLFVIMMSTRCDDLYGTTFIRKLQIKAGYLEWTLEEEAVVPSGQRATGFIDKEGTLINCVDLD